MVHFSEHRAPGSYVAKLHAKKYGPFRILAKINDKAYVVDLLASWKIPNTFNVSDLYEYFPEVEGSVVMPSNLRTSSFLGEGEFDAIHA